MARGRKASEDHVCKKDSPNDTGKWIVKDGQNIDFTSSDLSSERIIVECNRCGAVKQCLFEKLNSNHFNGTSYVIPEGLWDNIKKVESVKKNEERRVQVEKVATQLKEKAAAKKADKISSIKEKIINGTIAVSAKSSD